MRPATRRPRSRRLAWSAPLLLLGLLSFHPPVVLALGCVAGFARIAWRLRRPLSRSRPARAAGDAALAGGATLLGSDDAGRSVLVADGQLAAHGLVLGASGAGKTTTLLVLLGSAIARGQPVVALDLKGSPAFSRSLEAAAQAAGRRLRVWTLDGGDYWNPLGHGNPTELKDKLIATERFTEPHYKRAAERYVQTALQVLQQTMAERPVTLATVIAVLEPATLAALVRRLPPVRARAVETHLAGLGRDGLSAVRGLASRLAVIGESHTGAYLEAPPPDARDITPIDLRRALAGEEVVLFSLNSSRYAELAGQLGTLVVQDLVSAAGHRLASGMTVPALVAIDEFSALASDNVVALLARGREAGVRVLLSTQELADLDRAARGLREQVLGNTALKIAHRQDVPESADVIARMIGTVTVAERSLHSELGLFGTRRGTRESVRLVERFAVDPNRIRTLGTGEAVLITKTPRARAEVVHVRASPSGPTGPSSGRAGPPRPARRSWAGRLGGRGPSADGPER